VFRCVIACSYGLGWGFGLIGHLRQYLQAVLGGYGIRLTICG